MPLSIKTAFCVSGMKMEPSKKKTMRPVSTIQIKGRTIGPGRKTYLIAEMSVNHRQNFAEAVKILKAAKEAGADAVKTQTYTADTMTLESRKREFRIDRRKWGAATLHELYQKAFTPWPWQSKLKKIADKIGIDFFSTPFDATAVDYLETLKVPAYKIASFEIVDIPLIQRAAKTHKPLIFSTGMATIKEIEEAVRASRSSGNKQIALLKCTSAYPARPQEMNLKTIPFLIRKFSLPVGLSDHSQGISAAVTAVALGASIIEKHFILSRKKGGPDSAFSLEPQEFKQMAETIRVVEKMLGRVSFALGREEKIERRYRRSLFVVEDIKKGEKLTQKNIRSIRPAQGLLPKWLSQVLGKCAAKNVSLGTPLSWKLMK